MMRRQTRRSLGHLATIAALILIGVLWVRVLMVQPPPGEAVERLPSSPQKQPQLANGKLDQVSSAVSRLAESAKRGDARASVVHLTAAEINDLFTQPEILGVLEEKRISAPEVQLKPGRVITTATVEAGGASVRVRAEGALEARSGMLLYASDRVRVAGLPAPGRIRSAIDARIQEVFRQVEQRTGARVKRVTVGRDQITLHLGPAPD